MSADLDRQPIAAPSTSDVLDFITKPAPGESPAVDTTRAAARTRRRRR
jgi:hypothetical protein